MCPTFLCILFLLYKNLFVETLVVGPVLSVTVVGSSEGGGYKRVVLIVVELNSIYIYKKTVNIKMVYSNVEIYYLKLKRVKIEIHLS